MKKTSKYRLYFNLIYLILAVPFIHAETDLNLDKIDLIELYVSKDYEKILYVAAKKIQEGYVLSPQEEELCLISFHETERHAQVLQYEKKFGRSGGITPTSCTIIAWTYVHFGKKQIATRYLEKIDSPDSVSMDYKPEYYEALAVQSYLRGNTEKAVSCMIIADTYRPLDLNHDFLLSSYYVKLGDFLEASSRLKKTANKCAKLEVGLFVDKLARIVYEPLYTYEEFIETIEIIFPKVLEESEEYFNNDSATFGDNTGDLYQTIVNLSAWVMDANISAGHSENVDRLLKAYKPAKDNIAMLYVLVLDAQIQNKRPYSQIEKTLGKLHQYYVTIPARDYLQESLMNILLQNETNDESEQLVAKVKATWFGILKKKKGSD